jgi:hypothetical protein
MPRPKKAPAAAPDQRREHRAELLARLWDAWLERQVKRFEDPGAEVNAAELQAVRMFLADQGISRDALDRPGLLTGALGALDPSNLPSFPSDPPVDYQEEPEE